MNLSHFVETYKKIKFRNVKDYKESSKRCKYCENCTLTTSLHAFATVLQLLWYAVIQK